MEDQVDYEPLFNTAIHYLLLKCSNCRTEDEALKYTQGLSNLVHSKQKFLHEVN